MQFIGRSTGRLPTPRCTHKVLVLSTKLTGGGAENVARLMVEALEDAHSVAFNKDAEIVSDNVRSRVIHSWESSSCVYKIAVNIYRVCYIQCIKLYLNPELTISHLEGPNFVNLLTIGGGRRIIFVHNSVNKNYAGNNLGNRVKKIMIHLLYRTANTVVVVSNEIGNQLIEKYGVKKSRVICLPNPIDVTAINLASTGGYKDWRGSLLREKYMVSVASFSFQKNHEFLIEIFIRIKQLGFKQKLVLVGDGQELGKIHKLCQDKRLLIWHCHDGEYKEDAEVYFVGKQGNPYPFIRNADLFVMPSFWEGLPISLLEALCLGVPVVVSDCSDGIREVLSDGHAELSLHGAEKGAVRTKYGYLMPTPPIDDREASVLLWANSIATVLGDSEYRENCSIQGKRKASNFDIRNVTEIWNRSFMLC